MDRLTELEKMNELLLQDQPEYRQEAGNFPADLRSQRRLMRSLMNVRLPHALPKALIKMQDQILSEEREEKGVVGFSDFSRSAGSAQLFLWHGDITRIRADAVVNAANSQMLGCFIPCHGCIDNAIHSAAGLELREACARLMRDQGHEEGTGQAKITPGFNLPAKYVIHTVGPIVQGRLTKEHERLLASCYRSCLDLAEENGCASIAFCCISTGVFHFPNQRAAEIAVKTVEKWLEETGSRMKVVFNVFKDQDAAIYRRILGISAGEAR